MNFPPKISTAYARRCPLGEVLEFRNEIVHPRDNPKGEAVFVGLEHVQSNTGMRMGSVKIKLGELTGRRARFRSDDIVYGYLRPYLNKVWIAEFDGLCSVDQYVFKVHSTFDRNYVAHYLRSSEFLRSAPIDSAPGQLPRIRSGEIAAAQIPAPPLDEQRWIASILDKADALRRKRKLELELLEGLTQSVFMDMFGNPSQNFRQISEGVVGDLISETQYGTSAKAGSTGEFPIIRMSNITTGGRIDFTDMKFIDLSAKDYDRYTVRRGDILFNRTNSAELVGKTGLYDLDSPMAFAGYLIRLRLWPNAIPEYLHAHMNSTFTKTVLRRMAKSIVGMANINAKEMRTIPILLPSRPEQVEFRDRTTLIRRQITVASQAEKIAQDLFSSLQSQIFAEAR